MSILKSITGFVMYVIECWQETKDLQAKEYTKWRS